MVTSDGVKLSVTDTGPAHGAHTVVFLHGLCLTRTTWERQIERLLGEYGSAVRFISYDHRGHGSSATAPMGTYTIGQLADDLTHVLTTLHVEAPLTVVAHSMGGMAVLAYLSRPAAQRPVDPSGLVLVATAAGKLGERGLGRLLSTPATTGLTYVVANAPEHVLRGVVKPLRATLAWMRGRLPTASFASMTLAALTTTPASTAIGYLPSLRTYDLYPTLHAVRARTVIVSGGVDPLTPPKHARDLAAQIPGATHLNVPNAGHMLPQEAPDVIHHAIRQAMALDCTPQIARAPRITKLRTLQTPSNDVSFPQRVGAELPCLG